MKKLLLLGACLWALATPPAAAETGNPDIVVVKVLESPLATRFIIVRSSGFPEEIEVSARFTGNEASVAKESAQKMQEVLTELYREGYAIKSTYGGSVGSSSTLVLVRN